MNTLEKNRQNKPKISIDKMHLAAIGENMVLSHLMQNGWSAFNANISIKNYKSIDILCTHYDLKESDGYRPKTAFIQVKTSVDKSFPVGFNIGDCLDLEILKSKIIGPYVFVYIDKNTWDYRYFILSREEVIKLAYESHVWYIHKWNRSKPIKLTNPAALSLRWLEGIGENENLKHESFNNFLNLNSSENKWNKIWL